MTIPNPTATSTPSGILDEFLADPWDPFDGRIAHLESQQFPRRRLRDPSLPIGAFILAALLIDKPTRPNIRGLKLLNEFFGATPFNDFTGGDAETVESEIRNRAVQEAEERLETLLTEPPGPGWTRQVERAEVSVNRGGFSQWMNFLAAITWLQKFAIKHGVLPSELRYTRPMTSGQRAPQSRLRRALDEHEMHLVWDAARTGADPELATLVLDFIRETAARRQAVIDLTLDDINWAESTVTLHTKFNRVLTLPVSEDILVRLAVRNAVLGWDGHSRRRYGVWEPNPSRAAFRRIDGRALTAKYFERVFDKVERHVGEKIGVRVTAHWLRHTTIAQIDQIAGPDVAGQWAGHLLEGHGQGAGNATSHYIQWTMPQLKALHRRMFPDTPPGGIDPTELCSKFAWMQDYQGD